MKRSKRLGALLGVLVIICVAIFAVTHAEERKEQIKTSGEIVLEIPGDKVQALSWEYGGASYAFHRDEAWLYDEDEAFPVDEEKVGELLEQFEAFGVSFVIEDVTDYGMYGLDDPECTITLSTEEQSYEVALGDFSNMDEERYVSIGDGNVYLAKSDPLDVFNVALKDLLRDDKALAYEQVNRIEFKGGENYSIFYDEELDGSACADDVYYTGQNGETLPLDTYRVGTYLESMTTLYLDDYVTYNATDEELAAYGLDEPELTVTVDYTGKDENGDETVGSYVISVSRDKEKLAAAEEAEEKGEEAEDVTGYVRVGDSPIVYEISEYDCNNLMAAAYDDLRHREVLSADLEDVYQVDVSLEGESYSFFADGEDADGERIWKWQEKEIDLGDFRSALEGLRAKSSEDFTVEGSAGKEELRLTVYLESESHPTVEIALCRYDGNSCIAEVDGEIFALVRRTDAVKLIEAVNAIVLD